MDRKEYIEPEYEILLLNSDCVTAVSKDSWETKPGDQDDSNW